MDFIIMACCIYAPWCVFHHLYFLDVVLKFGANLKKRIYPFFSESIGKYVFSVWWMLLMRSWFFSFARLWRKSILSMKCERMRHVRTPIWVPYSCGVNTWFWMIESIPVPLEECNTSKCHFYFTFLKRGSYAQKGIALLNWLFKFMFGFNLT